jgi:hypothetical protein
MLKKSRAIQAKHQPRSGQKIPVGRKLQMAHQSLMRGKFLSGFKVPQYWSEPSHTRAPYKSPQLLLAHAFGAEYARWCTWHTCRTRTLLSYDYGTYGLYEACPPGWHGSRLCSPAGHYFFRKIMNGKKCIGIRRGRHWRWRASSERPSLRRIIQ